MQIPERNFFFIADSDHERNEWVAAIGSRLAAVFACPCLPKSVQIAQDRQWPSSALLALISTCAQLDLPYTFSTIPCAGRATTESRRVRSYSEEALTCFVHHVGIGCNNEAECVHEIQLCRMLVKAGGTAHIV